MNGFSSMVYLAELGKEVAKARQDGKAPAYCPDKRLHELFPHLATALSWLPADPRFARQECGLTFQMDEEAAVLCLHYRKWWQAIEIKGAGLLDCLASLEASLHASVLRLDGLDVKAACQKACKTVSEQIDSIARRDALTSNLR